MLMIEQVSVYEEKEIIAIILLIIIIIIIITIERISSLKQ